MELRQLRQFMAIAECGTMREAADYLLVSQSALSHSLKALEGELDCQLFERTNRNLVLTPYGKTLLRYARSISSDVDAAMADLQAMKRAEANRVRIVCDSLIPAAFELPDVASANPEFNFSCRLASQDAAIRALMGDVCDIACLCRQINIPGVTVVPYRREQAMLAVPHGNKLAELESISLSDIKDIRVSVSDGIPGLSEWYRELVNSMDVADEDIVYESKQEFLRNFNKTDHCHLHTNRLSRLHGPHPNHAFVPIDDPIALRKSYLAFRSKDEKRLKDVVDVIVKGTENVSAMGSNIALLLLVDNATFPNYAFEAGPALLGEVFKGF